jgi:hypothetical protein
VSATLRLDGESIEAIAQRVAELLTGDQAGSDSRLIDAATLARHLGVSPAFVYRNATKLGAIRLPTSPEADRGRKGKPRGRLRFDLEQARAALVPRVKPAGKPKPRAHNRRRRELTLQSRPRQ